MRRSLKIIIGFALVVVLALYWFLSRLTDAYAPTYNRVELVSVSKDKLYIKSKNWGVTGDHQLTVISTEDEGEFKIDSTKQIIFIGLEPFLYKVSNDTLFLTLRQKSKIPDGFNSRWIIIQREVDNLTMMNSMRNPELKRM
ncbi:MAG: hypothetical protein JSS79_10575 [Bacteroidetes bacterium]|nr:hypothetical protein [Bacteroidota bacterium]